MKHDFSFSLTLHHTYNQPMKHSHLMHYDKIIKVHHYTRENFSSWLYSTWHSRIPRTVILQVSQSFVVAHSSLLPVCEYTVEGIARSHLSIPFTVFHGADSWFPNHTLTPLSFSNAPVKNTEDFQCNTNTVQYLHVPLHITHCQSLETTKHFPRLLFFIYHTDQMMCWTFVFSLCA